VVGSPERVKATRRLSGSGPDVLGRFERTLRCMHVIGRSQLFDSTQGGSEASPKPPDRLSVRGWQGRDERPESGRGRREDQRDEGRADSQVTNAGVMS
jgi:hypothetical protein